MSGDKVEATRPPVVTVHHDTAPLTELERAAATWLRDQVVARILEELRAEADRNEYQTLLPTGNNQERR